LRSNPGRFDAPARATPAIPVDFLDQQYGIDTPTAHRRRASDLADRGEDCETAFAT
jgi:hypothetical protein